MHGDSRSTSATDLDLESSSQERETSGKAYAEGMTPPSASQGVDEVDHVFGARPIKGGPDYRAVRVVLPCCCRHHLNPTTSAAVASALWSQLLRPGLLLKGGASPCRSSFRTEQAGSCLLSSSS